VCACAPWGRGGSWAEDGTILFAPNANSPILSVPASGGDPVPVTTLDPSIPDVSHRFPVVLPDGDHFLFTLWSNSPEALAKHGGIYVGSRKGGSPRRLLADPTQAVLAPGALLLRRGEHLVAVPFDADALTVEPEATTVSPAVRYSPSVGDLYVSASTAGDFLFARGEGAMTMALDLVWLDRKGSATPAAERPLQASDLRLSPDGTRFVAVVVPKQTGSDDLWLGEFARGTVVRLTSGVNDSFAPRWSPDGRFIAFSNRDTGNEDVYRVRADGTGVPEKIFEAKDLDTGVTDWGAGGRLLFFNGASKTTQRGRTQVWSLDLETREAKLLLDSPRAAVGGATLSPDARWLAYVSDESGQEEVYVRSFPALDRKWQISQQGGSAPHWRRDGRELVFLAANVRIFAAPVAPQRDDLRPGMPELLFSSPRALLAFAPSPDHTRFLTAVLPAGRTEPPLRLILGWRKGGS
jgi:dipeptidyl aminopeptidase/acylaminoacyl peptidase